MTSFNSSHWVVLGAGELAWLLFFISLAGLGGDEEGARSARQNTVPNQSTTSVAALLQSAEAKNRFLKQQQDSIAGTNVLLPEFLGERSAALQAITMALRQSEEALGNERDRMAAFEPRLAEARRTISNY